MSRMSRSSAKKASKNINITDIVSHNLRGLKSDDRIDEIFNAIKSRNIFAACIQETWREGVNALTYEQSKILLAGLEPDEVTCNRGSQGVGIILSDSAEKAWKAAGSVVHNDLGARVIAARLLVKDAQGKNIHIFLVSAYAPIGKSEETVWNDFFDSLNTVLSRKHQNDIVIIGCDTNSSMGTRNSEGASDVERMSSVGNQGYSHINEAGKRFRSYLEMNNLVALTTYFRKKSYGTWMHPRSKALHQIDHFLTTKDSFHRFCDAGITAPLLDSDHQAIRCRLRLISRLQQKLPPRTKMLHLDHTGLSSNEGKSAFCAEVLNEMSGNEEEPLYSRLAAAATTAATKTLPKKVKANPGWFEAAKDTLLPLIEKRNKIVSELYSRSSSRRTRADSSRIRKIRKELKKAVQSAKNAWISEQCKRLNESSSGKGGTKTSWEMVSRLKNGLSKAKPSKDQRMQKEDGTLATTPEENAEVFVKHFDKLYNRHPEFDDTVLDLLDQHPIAADCDHPPTDEEIQKAISALKNAPGDSGICPPIWKALSRK